MMRTLLQTAFILHTRPYRENNALLDVFTQDFGRLSIIARDIRKAKSPLKAILQPFFPLHLSWFGKGDLVTLLSAELRDNAIRLSGTALMSGFYLNELLVRLLGQHVPYPELFADYQQALSLMSSPEPLESSLRWFEKRLLQALGYGLDLQHDIQQQPILSAACYKLEPLRGLQRCDALVAEPTTSYYFPGSSILALATDQYENLEHRRDAKRLMRMILDVHLNGYRLKSRQFWA